MFIATPETWYTGVHSSGSIAVQNSWTAGVVYGPPAVVGAPQPASFPPFSGPVITHVPPWFWKFMLDALAKVVRSVNVINVKNMFLLMFFYNSFCLYIFLIDLDNFFGKCF